MEVISRNPKTLQPSAVELNLNESFVSKIFDRYLDAGKGVIDAAQDALYDFYCEFPAAETDPETTPINWPFFMWLCGHPANHPGGYWNFDIMNQAPKWGTNLLVKMCEDRFKADRFIEDNYPNGR
jgi:hypothetical protein